MTIRQEWLMRASDSAPAACFVIYETHAEVLAILDTGMIDRSMPLASARALWTDLTAAGWRRATVAEIDEYMPTLKKLRALAYRRRP